MPYIYICMHSDFYIHRQAKNYICIYIYIHLCSYIWPKNKNPQQTSLSMHLHSTQYRRRGCQTRQIREGLSRISANCATPSPRCICLDVSLPTTEQVVYACARAHVRVCVHIYTHKYINACVYIYYIYVWINVRMLACMYTGVPACLYMCA